MQVEGHVAAHVPFHFRAGRGGCQRSAPTGAAAYGIPQYASVCGLACVPRSLPSATVATGPSSGGADEPLASGESESTSERHSSSSSSMALHPSADCATIGRFSQRKTAENTRGALRGTRLRAGQLCSVLKPAAALPPTANFKQLLGDEHDELRTNKLPRGDQFEQPTAETHRRPHIGERRAPRRSLLEPAAACSCWQLTLRWQPVLVRVPAGLCDSWQRRSRTRAAACAIWRRAAR